MRLSARPKKTARSEIDDNADDSMSDAEEMDLEDGNDEPQGGGKRRKVIDLHRRKCRERNREHARNTRERKKQEIDNLQARILELTGEVSPQPALEPILRLDASDSLSRRSRSRQRSNRSPPLRVKIIPCVIP